MNEKLKEEAVKEATALKQHATKNELKKLNFQTLDPGERHNCIYGQMTGDCHSARALTLLNLCAIPFSSTIITYRMTVESSFSDDIYFRSFSPIEFYISQKGANAEVLIQFLKGDKETITVDDL